MYSGDNTLFTDHNTPFAIALPLDHLLSCFSDTFTKQGVQLFYPNPAWAISVSNPRRRLKTGDASELWVLGIAIALLTLGFHLANGGGITRKVPQNLGLRDTIFINSELAVDFPEDIKISLASLQKLRSTPVNGRKRNGYIDLSSFFSVKKVQP